MTTFIRSSSPAAHTKPTSGEMSSDLPMLPACAQSTPLVPVLADMSWLARPTPMIEPMRVCELDDGRPNHQVPRFQMMAAMSSAKTIAKPGAAADLEDELDRQQRDDPEGHRARRDEDADEVPDARPEDREVRLERVRVDDGRDGVGRVVEAVHELEAERDEERDPEEDEGKHRAVWTCDTSDTSCEPA